MLLNHQSRLLFYLLILENFLKPKQFHFQRYQRIFYTPILLFLRQFQTVLFVR
jgi:hypothetical protein